MSRSDIIKEIERIYDESEVNGVVDTMEFGKKCYDQAIKEVLEKIDKMPNKFREFLENPELLEVSGIEIRKLVDAEELKASLRDSIVSNETKQQIGGEK